MLSRFAVISVSLTQKVSLLQGTAAFDGFSLPMGPAGRAQVARLIGEEAERIVFINCAMERGSQDVLHFGALRDLEATLSGPMVINHRADLDLAEAGWGEEALVLRNARELEMLILLSMADWLQQVHATDRLPAPALRPLLSVSPAAGRGRRRERLRLRGPHEAALLHARGGPGILAMGAGRHPHLPLPGLPGDA